MSTWLVVAVGSLVISQAAESSRLSLPTTYIDASEHVGYGDQPEFNISLGPGFDVVGSIPPGKSRLRFWGYAESYDAEHGDAAQIVLSRYRSVYNYDNVFLDWVPLPPPVDGVPVRVPIEAEWVFDEIFPQVIVNFRGGYAESGMLLGGTAEYTIGVPEPAGIVSAAVGGGLLLVAAMRRKRRGGAGVRLHLGRRITSSAVPTVAPSLPKKAPK